MKPMPRIVPWIKIPTQVKDLELVEKRRRQIAEAAMDLFVRKGFHPTTTREIARRAGISIGSLYEYVRSKEDILYLVCQAIHAEMEAKLKTALGRGRTGREVLVNAVADYFEVCDRMQDAILLIYQESSSLERASLRVVLQNDVRITAIFEDILGQGLKDGTLKLPGPASARLMAHDIIVLGHMWTFRRWFLGRKFTLKEYTRAQTALLLSNTAARDTAVPAVENHGRDAHATSGRKKAAPTPGKKNQGETR
jgi:AcrR family transcriptional regulator